jgi:3-hydroxyacyl-[acyl-carrier-protein] dehydratase
MEPRGLVASARDSRRRRVRASISAVELDIQRILRILPHRSPFLFVDRVIEVQPRKRARAIKCVSYNEPVFPGHFPFQPMFPNVLVLEALSQVLAILAYASEPFDPATKVFYQLGFDQVKFRRPIVPGDRVELSVEIVQRRSNIWKAHGEAVVSTHPCAHAELLAALTDRDELPSGP